MDTVGYSIQTRWPLQFLLKPLLNRWKYKQIHLPIMVKGVGVGGVKNILLRFCRLFSEDRLRCPLQDTNRTSRSSRESPKIRKETLSSNPFRARFAGLDLH